jgi:hypothetical protein
MPPYVCLRLYSCDVTPELEVSRPGLGLERVSRPFFEVSVSVSSYQSLGLGRAGLGLRRAGLGLGLDAKVSGLATETCRDPNRNA